MIDGKRVLGSELYCKKSLGPRKISRTNIMNQTKLVEDKRSKRIDKVITQMEVRSPSKSDLPKARFVVKYRSLSIPGASAMKKNHL